MIRTALGGLALAVIATLIAWFLIPADTYVENAGGILLLVFVVALVIGAVASRRIMKA